MDATLRRRWLSSTLIVTLLAALAASPSLAAATQAKPADQPAAAEPAKPNPTGLEDPAGTKALKYRLIGPAWGGRVSRVAGVPGDPSTYYAATASGGVWKSSDHGLTWESIFDDQPVSSIGSIAVAASDPNVVYVGSGEANIRGNVAAGDGIYKSLDGGKTWSHVWVQKGQIGQMAVDPRDADVAFAAVLGHAFGPNPERGVYRTRDGGKSWQQVLKKDELTGASAVALDPENPNIVFAGLWQAVRRPWEMTSGGPGSGLWVSRDGGDTWKQLTGDGLPDGPWGKIGVAVAPSDGRRVYALIEAANGGLYRSDDGGEKWTLASGSHELRQRAWYYSTLAVNPANPDEVWCPQVPMLRSIDGGKSFSHVKGLPHGDHHDVWFDPQDARRIINCDDGGVYVSTDGGESWFAPALPIGQFYHVSADSRVPFRVAGSLQDIGTAQGPSNSLSRAGIRNTDWYGVGGGEAGWVVSEPDDPDVVYAGEYGGYVSRYDHRTRQERNVSVYPDNPSGHGGEDMRYRFQWTAPIAVSPHDPKVVYHAGNVLFRSTDGGQSWSAISPDLTRDDKSKEKWSGGPITGDNTGVETYCTIFAVAESPLEKGLIWAGSDDGLVHVTRDGGATWTDVTAAMHGLPEWATVTMIEPSRFDAGTAWVTVDAHRLDDTHPYLFQTTDDGRTWTRLDSRLPQDVYLHAVREDPAARGTLYLGTERGVDQSTDGGATWHSLRLNLPTVAVHDLAIADDSLVVATHGRSFWILDDLSAVRALTPAVAAQDVAFVAVPRATEWSYSGDPRDRFSGDNPPRGARIYYWLKEKPKGEVTLEVIAPDGRLVERLSSKAKPPTGSSEYVDEEREALEKDAIPAEAGLQRAVWGFTWTGADMLQGGMVDWGYPADGARALPDTYTLRLTADGKSATTTLEVVQDPRLQVSKADLEAQLATALVVRDAISRLTHDVDRLRSVREQLTRRNALLAGDGAAEALVKGSTALIGKLDDLEARMQNPKAEIVYDILAQKGGTKLYSRLAFLYDTVKDGPGAPTQGVREQLADEKAELDRDVSELSGLLSGELAALDAQARTLGLPTIFVPSS